jgi:hypothetical protein
MGEDGAEGDTPCSRGNCLPEVLEDLGRRR